MIFIKSIFLSFTIWILAALLNALLGGTLLTFFSHQYHEWPGAYLLVFICTLIFSMPAMFIFWIVLLANWDEELLFRLMLKTGFIISALSSLLLFILPVGVVKVELFFLSLCIVIATITSLMIHHSIIKSISKNKITENHA